MKDNELRGVVLKKLYEERHHSMATLSESAFEGQTPLREIRRICRQLAEYGLAKYVGDNGDVTYVRILAPGVDAVESEGQKSPVELQFPAIQNIHVVNSSNVIIGNANTQEFQVSVEKIIAAINQSTVTEAQKTEAKGLLRKFLEHPLVTSIAGGLTSLIK
jgi:hypothetical protein